MADDRDSPTSQSAVSDGAQVISDPAALQALAHPVRLSLLEALLGGPLTATEAGALIGETSTTCSFHLRQLARYGFVEEAGGGRGRARPWRRTHASFRIPVRPDDVAFTQTSVMVHGVMLDRYFERVRHAILGASRQPQEWHEAIIGTETTLFVTAEELQEIGTAYAELQRRFAERWQDRMLYPERRPDGTRTVELLFFGLPVDEARGAHP